jgi:hypothetical protein
LCDNASKWIMAYKIDANRNTIVPIRGADMRKIFNRSNAVLAGRWRAHDALGTILRHTSR